MDGMEVCSFHSAGNGCYRELQGAEDRVHHPLHILCLRHRLGTRELGVGFREEKRNKICAQALDLQGLH